MGLEWRQTGTEENKDDLATQHAAHLPAGISKRGNPATPLSTQQNSRSRSDVDKIWAMY